MFSDLGLANALMERVSARTSRVKRTAILVTGGSPFKFGCGGPHLAALQTMPEIDRPVCDVEDPVRVSPEPPVAGETRCVISSDNKNIRVTRCPSRIRKWTTAVRQRKQGGSLRCLLRLKAQIWRFAPSYLHSSRMCGNCAK